ncbi:tigger transposable element-derived protein 6-like [Halichondria panicea]|uniref:tigger transposable element-derived protein 6-like n=1 Tax=Halichondria panicea TaxID=6063 RepID=UPI00312BC88C
MRFEVIQAVEKEPKIGTRKLAETFKCGRTQIQLILKNKDHIKDLYFSNVNSNRAQCQKRTRKSEYADINEALLEWYQLAISRNIFPDGTILTEKAIQIAERLGFDNFTASSGWLTRWKARNSIKQRIISGESGDVRSDTVESWFERIPCVVEGYEPRDIWNCDETGLFWRALPDKGLAVKNQECKGGKESKLRITALFFVNALGESESPPIVIWKSENPRCFKGIDKSKLPVWYYAQKKSWMNSEILHDILIETITSQEISFAAYGQCRVSSTKCC